MLKKIITVAAILLTALNILFAINWLVQSSQRQSYVEETSAALEQTSELFEAQDKLEYINDDIEFLQEMANNVDVLTERELSELETPDRVGGDYPSYVGQEEYEAILAELKRKQEEQQELTQKVEDMEEEIASLQEESQNLDKVSVWDVVLDNLVQVSMFVLNIVTIIGLIIVRKKKPKSYCIAPLILSSNFCIKSYGASTSILSLLGDIIISRTTTLPSSFTFLGAINSLSFPIFLNSFIV